MVINRVNSFWKILNNKTISFYIVPSAEKLKYSKIYYDTQLNIRTDCSFNTH